MLNIECRSFNFIIQHSVFDINLLKLTAMPLFYAIRLRRRPHRGQILVVDQKKKDFRAVGTIYN
jgi:hypothetical protein